MANFFASNDATFAQALLDAAANPGEDNILVTANTYSGSYVIDSDVTIIGPKAGQAGNAVLRGSNEAIFSGGLEITASSVTIDGIMVTGVVPLAGGFPTGLRVSATGTDAVIKNTLFDGEPAVDQLNDPPTVGLTLNSFGTTATRNAFVGYDEGIFVVGDSSADINNNFFNNQAGIFTESTFVLIGQNTFSDLVTDLFSNPNVSNDLSSQFLFDNTVSFSNPFRDVQIIPRIGATNITGTFFGMPFAEI
jgi:hypothetical protein